MAKMNGVYFNTEIQSKHGVHGVFYANSLLTKSVDF